MKCKKCGRDVRLYLKQKKPIAFGFRSDGEVYAYAYCICGNRLASQKIDKEKAFEYLRKMGV